jgi:glycosyltransferase involved in cell wall biosynthesis
MPRFRKPQLSVVIILYNMTREAPRTLYSLSSAYQQGVRERDYEIIVVDNGSKEPIPPSHIYKLGRNFRYYVLKNASPSPCAAINFGVNKARGKFIGVMIDGARILSPGVLRYALKAFRCYPNPVVSTVGFHLGPEFQPRALLHGYNQDVEDQLLEQIDWKQNGYKLFEIACFAGSSESGWFENIDESNCVFMKKATFTRLGGYDMRFGSPGGGLVNLDMYKRALENLDSTLVTILGEGNFHQLHGGISTNVSLEKNAAHWNEYIDPFAIFHIPDRRRRKNILDMLLVKP